MNRRRIVIAALLGCLTLVAVAVYVPPVVQDAVRQSRYWGPLPANDVVGVWTDASGQALPDGSGTDAQMTVVTSRGNDDSCLRKVIFLRIAWPVGSVVDERALAPDAPQSRIYIRDPDDAFHGSVDGDVLILGATAPGRARPTGFTRAGNSLSIDPDGAAYVTRPDGTVELWPRQRPMADFYCM